MGTVKVIAGLSVILYILWSLPFDEEKPVTIRYPIGVRTKIPELDTSAIRFHQHYVLLMQLLSPLVTVDQTGNIVAGLAEKFYWKNGSLHLVLRDNVKSATGKTFGPEDVVLTFKRLMILSRNTHGDLADFLCPDNRPRSF